MLYSLLRYSSSLALGTLIALSILIAQPVAAQAVNDLRVEQVQKRAGFSDAELANTIGGLIKVALGLLGILMVVMMLLGGFGWMTTSGNDDAREKAVRSMVGGVIGLLIIVSAYSISNFLVNALL